MKYVLKLLLLVLLSCASAEMRGATATVNKVWLEHGTKFNNRYVLKVNVDFSVKGGKGEKFSWCVWLKGPNNEWHRMNNAHYNRDGVAYMQSSYFTPPYDDTRYSNAWMSIYIDDLNMLPGKNKYKVIVTVDQSGKVLGQSDPVSFDGTGSSKSDSAGNNSYNNNSGNRVNNNSGDVQTWREELGYGGFVIVKKFPNGYIMRTRYRICPNCNGTQACGNCHGTGICPICNGQGGIISAGYGNYYPCYSCQSSGRCMLCRGNRVCSACHGSDYSGYVIGSTSTIAPDGTTTRDNANYNGYDSSGGGSGSGGGNNSGSSKGCYKCGGTGVDKTPNSGGSLTSWIAYYNSSGSKCPYCGGYTSHYHDRCAGCNVPR